MSAWECCATICNQKGLHARAAAEVVTLSCSYRSEIKLGVSDKSASGKSLIQLLMLAAKKGTVVSIFAEGDDAQAAAEAIQALIKNRFNEDF